MYLPFCIFYVISDSCGCPAEGREFGLSLWHFGDNLSVTPPSPVTVKVGGWIDGREAGRWAGGSVDRWVGGGGQPPPSTGPPVRLKDGRFPDRGGAGLLLET